MAAMRGDRSHTVIWRSGAATRHASTPLLYLIVREILHATVPTAHLRQRLPPPPAMPNRPMSCHGSTKEGEASPSPCSDGREESSARRLCVVNALQQKRHGDGEGPVVPGHCGHDGQAREHPHSGTGQLLAPRWPLE